MRPTSDPAEEPGECRGAAPPDGAPVFDALCAHYAQGLASGGDVRWLAHAWSTLAVVGEVPVEIPSNGIEGADARIRLAALALFGATYDGADEEPEPPAILEGPHALAAADMAAWMAAHDLMTVAQLQAEAERVDPDAPTANAPTAGGAAGEQSDTSPVRDAPVTEPPLCTEDVEFAIDAIAGEVIGAYSRLRPQVVALFAELWAQSYPASDPEDADDSRNGGTFVFPHSTYPLPDNETLMILNDNGSDTEKRAAMLRLFAQMQSLRS